MNVYDSTRMMDALASTGYEPTASVDEADMIILNTCHIREKAAEKVYSELGRLRQVQESRVRTDGSRVLIAVAGCVAQAEGEEIVVVRHMSISSLDHRPIIGCPNLLRRRCEKVAIHLLILTFRLRINSTTCLRKLPRGVFLPF